MLRLNWKCTAIMGLLLAAVSGPAKAQEPMIGEIKFFAGNFAPRGWAFCDGQLLAISQNTALFSILGTTYGGDGRTTFGLPDMRGRSPLHAGRGPGLSDIRQGQKGGSETVTGNNATLANHVHSIETVPIGAPIRNGSEIMGIKSKGTSCEFSTG